MPATVRGRPDHPGALPDIRAASASHPGLACARFSRPWPRHQGGRDASGSGPAAFPRHPHRLASRPCSWPFLELFSDSALISGCDRLRSRIWLSSSASPAAFTLAQGNASPLGSPSRIETNGRQKLIPQEGQESGSRQLPSLFCLCRVLSGFPCAKPCATGSCCACRHRHKELTLQDDPDGRCR